MSKPESGHVQGCMHVQVVLTLFSRCQDANSVAWPKSPCSVLAGVARSGPGIALLQGWSYTSDDVAGIEERLQQMASCYDNED